MGTADSGVSSSRADTSSSDDDDNDRNHPPKNPADRTIPMMNTSLKMVAEVEEDALRCLGCEDDAVCFPVSNETNQFLFFLRICVMVPK